jgi:ABC-type uncharacterized transport system ATPase subunit
MNDLATNKFALVFQNISNMVTRNNYTNIILINIPHRYDITNTNTANGNIEKFNKKLEEHIKLSPHARFLKTNQNRKLFMMHALCYNRLGKQHLFYQTALKVHSLVK